MSSIARLTNEPWQELRPLPNTRPYTSHHGINLGCARCGALALRDDEILSIRNGSVWGRSNPDFVAVSEAKDDNCNELEVRCEECNNNLGVYYKSKPETKDPIMEKYLQTLNFPAIKVMYLRQSSGGVLFNKTILLGDEDVIRRGVAHLQLVSSLPKLT